MNIVLQVLLAICLVAGLRARGDSPPESDDLDVEFFGIDDSDRGIVDDIEDDANADDDITTPASRPGHGRRHRDRQHKGRHNGRRGPNRWNWTAEQKIGYICNATQSTVSNARIKFTTKLNRLNSEVREQITSALAVRKEQMAACCQLAGAQRMQCAHNIRKQRYNRVCNNEEPLCIWSIMKKQSNERLAKSTATKERCCALQDQERYTCFDAARESYRHNWRSRNRDS